MERWLGPRKIVIVAPYQGTLTREFNLLAIAKGEITPGGSRVKGCLGSGFWRDRLRAHRRGLLRLGPGSLYIWGRCVIHFLLLLRRRLWFWRRRLWIGLRCVLHLLPGCHRWQIRRWGIVYLWLRLRFWRRRRVLPGSRGTDSDPGSWHHWRLLRRGRHIWLRFFWWWRIGWRRLSLRHGILHRCRWRLNRCGLGNWRGLIDRSATFWAERCIIFYLGLTIGTECDQSLTAARTEGIARLIGRVATRTA